MADCDDTVAAAWSAGPEPHSNLAGDSFIHSDAAAAAARRDIPCMQDWTGIFVLAETAQGMVPGSKLRETICFLLNKKLFRVF